MIRKLILPAVAVLLLAGCMTGYTYRSAPGDYYHGQPTTVYRDYYGYPYSRGYYSPYSWGGYGYYGYRYSPYYYGRYGRYYGYPRHTRPDRDHDHDRTPDRKTPPWRDLGQLKGDRSPTSDVEAPRVSAPRMGAPNVSARRRPVQTHTPRPAPTRRPAASSRMSEMIRRAQPIRDSRRTNDD